MIPITDSVRARSFPYVNVAIIVINFLVFFYELELSGADFHGSASVSELDRFIVRWGNIPACTFDALGWQRDLTRTRRGDVRDAAASGVDDLHARCSCTAAGCTSSATCCSCGSSATTSRTRWGTVRYAVFYLLVGAIAALAHGVVNSNDLAPAIGASGAIAGVMGAYIVLYPARDGSRWCRCSSSSRCPCRRG